MGRRHNDFVSLYNAVALLLSRLKYLNPELFYRYESLDGLRLSREAEAEISRYLCDVKSSANASGKELSYFLVHYGVPSESLNRVLSEEKIKGNFKAIHEIINALTKSIQIDDLTKFIQELSPGFISLNDNAEETGFLILPRFAAINERIESGADDGRPPYTWANDRFHIKYSHLYYIEKEKLTTDSGRKYTIKNYIMDTLDTEKTALDNLIVAVSPISFSDSLILPKQFDTRQDEAGNTRSFFHVDGLKNVQRIHSRIESAFIAACRIKADILLFPEMFGDAESFGDAFWEKLFDQAESEDLQVPKVIITPTWWHKNKNELKVMTNGMETLFIQQKQYPFDFKTAGTSPESIVTEDLRDIDNTIHILHYPGIGRLVVPICKDYLIASYRNILLKELYATVTLIPSFSFGATFFGLSMLDAMQYGCYVIWINTCSAFWSKTPPVFIGAAANPFATIGQSPCTQINPVCGMQCGEDSNTCLFAVSISLGDERTVTCEHVFYPKDNM